MQRQTSRFISTSSNDNFIFNLNLQHTMKYVLCRTTRKQSGLQFVLFFFICSVQITARRLLIRTTYSSQHIRLLQQHLFYSIIDAAESKTFLPQFSATVRRACSQAGLPAFALLSVSSFPVDEHLSVTWRNLIRVKNHRLRKSELRSSDYRL